MSTLAQVKAAARVLDLSVSVWSEKRGHWMLRCTSGKHDEYEVFEHEASTKAACVEYAARVLRGWAKKINAALGGEQ